MEDTLLAVKKSESNLSDDVEFDLKFWCRWRRYLYSQHSVGTGSWISVGIETTSIEIDVNTTTVECESSHLTSFAVLVDVAGGHQVYYINNHSKCYKIVYSITGYFWRRTDCITDHLLHWLCHIGCLPHNCCSILFTGRVIFSVTSDIFSKSHYT